MDVYLILKILTLIVGFYMAWNIGANDVSNAMGTSVGSGALTLRRAVILAAIFEFGGAFLVGGQVSQTIQTGIIDTDIFASSPLIFIFGMVAALLGTGIWLQIASYFGWPVSTTHAIVGAVLGFGAIIGGLHAIHWGEIGKIALSWVISPLMSGLLSFIFFLILQKNILFAMKPIRAAKKIIPILVFISITVYALSLVFNGLKKAGFDLGFGPAVGWAALAGACASFFSYLLLKKHVSPMEDKESHSPQHVVSLEKAIKHLTRVRLSGSSAAHKQVSSILHDVKELSKNLKQKSHFAERSYDYQIVERFFVYLQIISACFIAFAHGANDVANAIGPMSAVLNVIQTKSVLADMSTPTWLLAFGGVGIVVGLATWGWRVIATIGKKITELTPTRGFCAEFGAATTILLASKLGLPVSTTHCLVGAVLGVGLARGMRSLNLSTLRGIVLSWVVTIPASAAVSIAIFFLLKVIFT